MPNDATWIFRKIDDGQKHVEPTHREHLATGGASEPLVREAIQNSLDATIPGKITKVVMTLATASADSAKQYFNKLREHLTAISKSLPDLVPLPSAPVRFLTIEDFNTRGLEGDPAHRKPLNADGTKNHFFRFWHSVGQSAGDFKRRGSWGIGKVVFSNASRIRTFFGLTRRTVDAAPLLMGEAGLTIHSLPGSDDVYDWYGYYAVPERVNGAPMPIQDASVVSQFAKTFFVDRATPGLSIVVPFVREEVKLNELARAVIEQYFLPILSGRLEVVICDQERVISISSSTIDDAVTKVKWPTSGLSTQSEMLLLLRIARWQIALSQDQYIRLTNNQTVGSNTLNCDSFPDESLEQVSSMLSRGEPIALKFPVCVRPKSGEPAFEDVTIVLERDESLSKGDVPHIRSGINVSKMRDRGGLGVRGILIVGVDSEESQGELDKLLQASEGPAHVNWEDRGEGYDKARSLYEDAHKTIRFMRSFVQSLVAILGKTPDAKDTRSLAVLFPDSDSEGVAGGENGGDRTRQRKPIGKKTPKAPPPIGVIEGVVLLLAPASGARTTVQDVEVRLTSALGFETAVRSDENGNFRFTELPPDEYELTAHKESIGHGHKTVLLPTTTGVWVDLFLRPGQPPKMYNKLRLEDGFAIRGNDSYSGVLQPIRVRLVLAAWGGSKSFTEADFDLNDEDLIISFSGIQETRRQDLIESPNQIIFTPVVSDFYVEVRGFDVNRALIVDARALEVNSVTAEAAS